VTTTPVNPAGADIVRLTGSTAPSFAFMGLRNGTVYSAKVRPKYGANYGAFSAQSAAFTPPPPALGTQPITVTRPPGALVLTQICGNHSARPADPAVGHWWPGSPAQPPVTNGTAPTLGPGGAPDPLFNQYPYPTDAAGDPTAAYRTDCAVNLGTARFITTGPDAGRYFQVKGLLSQVTVMDTRDSDPGWTASAQMGAFSAGPAKSFSGGQVGWTPMLTGTTSSSTDASGNTYTQTVVGGTPVAPGTNGTGGLGTAAPLGTAPPAATVGNATTGGLGIAVFDADLQLLIPVFAKSGSYTGTLTVTAA